MESLILNYEEVKDFLYAVHTPFSCQTERQRHLQSNWSRKADRDRRPTQRHPHGDGVAANLLRRPGSARCRRRDLGRGDRDGDGDLGSAFVAAGGGDSDALDGLAIGGVVEGRIVAAFAVVKS